MVGFFNGWLGGLPVSNGNQRLSCG